VPEREVVMRSGWALLGAWTVLGVFPPSFAAAQPATAPGAATEYTGPQTGVVRLPWADFRDLMDRLRALQAPEEAPPPVPSVIGSAVYRIAVDAEERQAQVDAEIGLVVLQREGWVDVPLLPDTAALEAFTVDGRAATLTQRDGFHRLIAEASQVYYGAPTTRMVTMTYRVNVQRDDGPHGIVVPLSEAGITRLELSLPRPDQEVKIEPDGVVLERTSVETGTTIVALVPRTTSATIHWSDRAAPMREEPVRAVADVVHRVAFQRHVVSGEVTVSVQVERGSFEAVVLRFPKEAEGIRATGDFSVDVTPEGSAAQLATVRAGYARRENTMLTLRYEMARNVGKLSPPDVKVVRLIQGGEDREIVRQAGFLVLYAAEGMEVRPDGAPTGAEPCDITEVPGSTELTGQAVLSFRTSGQACAVPLEVTRHEERAVLASAAQYAQLDLVVNREGKAVGDLVLSVQNNERQFIGVWLPRQAQLWATFVRGLPVKPSGENEWVMIPVPRSTIGADGIPETIPVEVIYYQDVPRIEGLMGDGTFDVPRVDLLVSSYAIAVYVPDEFRYFAFEGDAKPDSESVGPALQVAEVTVARSPVSSAYVTLENRNAWAQMQTQPTADNGIAVNLPTKPSAGEELESDRQREELAAIEEPKAMEDEEEGGRGARAAGDEGKMGRRDAEDVDRMAGVMGPADLVGGQAEDKHRAVSDDSRGLLPIRVDVARQGVLLRFTRSLVEPKDETEIEFQYQGRPVLATFPWLRGLAGLLLAFGLARLAHRSILRRRFVVGTVAPVSFTAGVALAVVLAAVLRAPLGGLFMALLAGMVVYAAVVAAVLLVRYWKQHKPGADEPSPETSGLAAAGGPPAPGAPAATGEVGP
jgi:hypothetical protein